MHQLHLEKIEVVGSCCKHLQILYLQNNLIPKIENLKKLKKLRYLNLALNNIKVVQGLRSCESLQKLDLTVNFVGAESLEESVNNLRRNVQLRTLFLSGNPCCEFKGYRSFVVASLPQLEKLDGKAITKSERIVARQDLERVRAALRAKTGVVPELKDEEEEESEDETESSEAFTAENRLRWYKEELEEEKKRKETLAKTTEKYKPKDPLKQAREKMSQKVTNVPEGKLPPQRNMPRLKFEISDDGKGNIVAVIHAPKFLDTSEIDVDIHPRWLQCMIKGKNLLLHTPEEVCPDKSSLKRMLHNGQLVITMPRVEWDADRAARTKARVRKEAQAETKRKEKERQKRRVQQNPTRVAAEQERDSLCVDYKNIVANYEKARSSKAGPAAPAPSAAPLTGVLTRKSAYDLHETHAKPEGDSSDSSDVEEMDDVPPLM